MLDIKLTVRFLWVFKKNIHTKFPAKWSDMTKSMVLPLPDLISLFFFAAPKKNKVKEFYEQSINERLLLIYPFLGIKSRLLFNLDTYQLNALLECTSFLVYGDKLLNTILIDNFKLGRKQYHGPSDKFSNLKFGEFIQADTYFMHYSETEDEEYIYLLIACLSRPQKSTLVLDSPGWDGDVREKFNQHLIKQRAKQFKRMPIKLRNTILFNYHSIRRWLTERYIYVFGSYADDSDDSTTSSSSRNEGWKGIIKNMSSSVLDIEKYADQSLHNILDDLDDKILADLKR